MIALLGGFSTGIASRDARRNGALGTDERMHLQLFRASVILIAPRETKFIAIPQVFQLRDILFERRAIPDQSCKAPSPNRFRIAQCWRFFLGHGDCFSHVFQCLPKRPKREECLRQKLE
jgi:hypothetical protein